MPHNNDKKGIMEITVKMGGIKVAKKPAILKAVGLGSCVAVVLYDRDTAIGALAHIMLPFIKEARDKSRPARFADVAVGMMIDGMRSRGARVPKIKARIFGGANMFPEIISPGSAMDVGKKNVAAVREELKKRNIEIVVEGASDLVSRSVAFNTGDGSVKVKTAGPEEDSAGD